MPDIGQSVPAATVILVRDRADGPPELLMVERASGMAFAGGAMVFPGGRVDPGDQSHAAELGLATPIGAATIAGIRETIEEVGVGVGLAPPPGSDALSTLRASLARGLSIGPALAEIGARIDADALVYFSRWLPKLPEKRVFDTTFFVARAERHDRMSIDGGECVSARWATAGQMLDDAATGRCRIIFPTRRNLERLAQFGSFDEISADALAHPVMTITPSIQRRDGVDYLCIPEGLGYPITAEPLGDVQRG